MIIKPKKTVELAAVAETKKMVELAPAPEVANSYWTPVAKTEAQYTHIKNELQKTIVKVINDKQLKCPFDFPYKLINGTRSSRQTYITDVYILLDGYAYAKSKQSVVVDAILEHFNIKDKPEMFIKTPTCTKFMYEGVQVVLVHWEEGFKSLNKRFYSDSVRFILGYNGEGGKLFNILLNRFNFRFDEFYHVNYDLKNEHGEIYRTFDLHQSLSLACKLLGIEEHGYPISLHGNMREIDSMVGFLMASDYLGKDSFYVDENNNYIGPEDYFGCELFKDIVSHLRTNPKYTKPDYPVSAKKTPDFIWKAQFKLWQTSVGGTDELIQAKDEYNSNRLIYSKLPDSLIVEVIGKEDPKEKSEFIRMFEMKVSETEDFNFFMLSSSEDTIRTRIQEFGNSLRRSQP